MVNKKSLTNSPESKHLRPRFKYALALLTFTLASLGIWLFACPQTTYADTENDLITITISVEGFQGSVPTLVEGSDFTAGQPVKADPRFMVDGEGNQILASLIEEKESEGYKLVWETTDGAPFDWFATPITQSITVVGGFEKADYSVRVSFNDEKTQDIEVSVPKGSSFEDAYGGVPETPTKQGHTFIRWVNSNDNSTFDFSAPVEASTTVYALFSISEPDQVVTVDADVDVPETATGRCYIGATWSVHPAKFSVSGFTGELEGCSGTGKCSLPSAAAPSYTWADYKATLADVDISAGIVTYDVTITPPGAASPDGPRNSLGLIGYQTVYFEAKVQKNFGGYIELSKVSENASLSEENATYSLKDAVFGVYDKHGNRVAQLKTDEHGNTGRSPLLPVGTYTIKEEQTPAGFASTTNKSVPVHSGSVTQSTISNIPQSSLVDLVLQKLDTETNAAYPLGSATLGEAQFQVSYYDHYLTVPAMVKSALNAFAQNKEGQSTLSSIPQSWGSPQRSWIFKTDANGKLHFSKDYLVEGDAFYYDHEGSIVLPLGTVEIKEIKAPQGYLLNEQSFVVSLNENGNEPHIESWQTLSVSEQVKRGDVSFTKVREGSMDRLANIPFCITSKTTGESHVLVTDENGMASTESSWAPHSQNTNKGSSADDGIWFGADTSGNTTPVNDSLGALPYDTYTIEELPCSANEGMLPVAFEVTISRDKVTLDMGTLDNKPYTPEISGEVDKRQTLFESNGLFTYTIDYRSTSPTWADEFTTADMLTCSKENQAHLRALATPVSVGDYDEKMNVWYQTNKDTEPASEPSSESNPETYQEGENSQNTTEDSHNSESVQESDAQSANACSTNPYNPDNPHNERKYDFEGWHLWEQNLSTTKSSLLFVDDLHLAEGEYITAVAFEHGRVEEGFGTLSQSDEQWDRRNRYENGDTIENAFDSSQMSSWDSQSCAKVLNELNGEESNRATTGTQTFGNDHFSATDQTADTNHASTTSDASTTDSVSTTNYAPAVLFMQASKEILESENIELWNDARIDIYRNLELHDEDKDSVVQTTVQHPIDSPNNPVEKLLAKLPKTGDAAFGLTALLTAVGAVAAALLIFLRKRHKQ